MKIHLNIYELIAKSNSSNSIPIIVNTGGIFNGSMYVVNCTEGGSHSFEVIHLLLLHLLGLGEVWAVHWKVSIEVANL